MRNERHRCLVTCIWILIGSTIASAQNWAPINWPNLGCESLSCSADGSTLVVASQWEPLCTSSNSGVSWISNAAPAYGWYSVASSADGNKLAAAGFSYTGGAVYLSTNRGASWFSSSIPTNAVPTAMASSADGTRLVVVGQPGSPICVSTNSGGTWETTHQFNDNYTAVASSSDGITMVAVGWGGGVYVSTNGGMDWIPRGVVNELTACACSSDGTKMVVAQRSSRLYLSSDSGATWTETVIPGTEWISVSMSSDGKQIAAFSDFNPPALYRSTNFGATWFTNSPPKSNPSVIFWIASLAFSADGNRLLAPVFRDSIYAADTAAPPSLAIASTDTNVRLSWLVPSTKFELEQNSNLASTGWSTVANIPTLNFTNLHYQADLPAQSGNSFYRLRKIQ